MRPGEPSITAQRVAVHRLTFDRELAPYGDPAADELLARDVAGDVAAGQSHMVTYLAARTSFFDRVVVRALDGGMRQVVIAGAGYDGRALRYAKPGVRWFEIDHPDTQRDKRSRLDRLGLDTEHITFVPLDFTADGVATAMSSTTHEPSAPTLIVCEGVAVYLDRPVLDTLLRGLRAIASARSRLAISVSISSDDPGLAERRATFQSAVAAVGEPARTVLTADDADALFGESGWRPVEPTGQERREARRVADRDAGVTPAARDDDAMHERASRLPGAFVWTGSSKGETRILPDGCMDLIWRNGTVTIAGPDTHAHVFARNDWSTAVGLRFPPGFGPRVIGVPARELADSRVSLDDVWSPGHMRHLVERLAIADDPGAVLEDIALEHATADDPDAFLVDDIARRARRGDAVMTIAAAVGLSTRQLQRRCADAFGYGAKTLVRILRMTRAVEMARAGTTFADTAAVSGYADQAHLSRDVKELAGVSLGQLASPVGNGANRSTEWPSGS